MKVKQMCVQVCDRREIKDFIEKWHYSRSINGLKSSYCFKLLYDNEIIGGMIYGQLGMASVWKKYADAEDEVLELRRLCCIDATPKNTESYFIGHTLRWLKKHTTTKVVLSYADPYYGHEGIIYKASNFRQEGNTSSGKMIIWEGRKYHDKAIRTYHINKHGEKILKPFAVRLKTALEAGEAYYINTPGKVIYTYTLVKPRLNVCQ